MHGENELNFLYKKLEKKIKRGKIKHLNVFNNTLQNKFQFSKHCLTQIEEIKSNESDYMSMPYLIDFYIDYFFINTFSVFDILSQIINVILLIEKNHRKVSFDYLLKSNTMKRFPDKNKLFSYLLEVKAKTWFIELEDFRHCALHNRNIYNEDIIRRRKGGYYQSDADTYEKFLAKDPWSWSPIISKKKEVSSYCSKLLNNTKAVVENTLRFLCEPK